MIAPIHIAISKRTKNSQAEAILVSNIDTILYTSNKIVYYTYIVT